MEQQVIPFDLHRMFLGEHPLLFYAEVIVRTLIIYLYTLLMIRWIGGRGIGQLSMVEFVLVIALGSAVGDSMFYPEVPLLMAMVVIAVVIGMNKLLDMWILRSDKAKDLIEGKPIELVRDGRLLHEGMEICQIGAAEIKGMLRLQGVRNLGEVEHAFMESNGRVSVFMRDNPLPGLSLLPPESVAPPQSGQQQLRDAQAVPDGRACCLECGALADAVTVLPEDPCEYCRNTRWVAPQAGRGKGTE